MLKDFQLSILGLCVLAAVVIASLIGANALLKIKQYPNEVITVTGSHAKLITSDSGQWGGIFYRRATTLKDAYAYLKNDRAKVISHLAELGIQPADIVFESVNTRSIMGKNDRGYSTGQVIAFELSQRLSVELDNVAKVTEVSQKISDLITNGVDVRSNAPQYFYTKLDDLKVEMLGLATKNAYERAKSMAESTNRHVGFLRSANMGVFQITSKTSNDVSDYGINDTSSVDKKVTAVVNATFTVE